MKKTKLYYLLALIPILLIGFTFITKANQEDKVVTMSSKHEGFTSVEEMEDSAEVIIVGTKREEQPVFLKREDDSIAEAHTLSQVEVLEVIKNTTQNDLSTGNKLTVLENAVEVTDSLGNKTFYHVDGYQLMKQGKKYLLYLQPSISDIGHYIPKGVVYGKVPVETDENELFVKEKEPSFTKVIDEAQEKYKKEKKK